MDRQRAVSTVMQGDEKDRRSVGAPGRGDRACTVPVEVGTGAGGARVERCDRTAAQMARGARGAARMRKRSCWGFGLYFKGRVLSIDPIGFSASPF